MRGHLSHTPRFRRWLGTRLGGDEVLGDRVFRRGLHAAGAATVLYLVIPTDLFVVLPKEYVLLLALAAVLLLEGLRHSVGVALPTLRPYEQHRVGSYVFYAIALTGALLLFPPPISAAVILGTALIDPLAGELRLSARFAHLYPGLPLAAYAGLALYGFIAFGGWPPGPSLGLAVLAAAIAIAVERPQVPWIDDDLAMMFAPALALFAVGVLGLGLRA